ncbi:MAG: MBL fold metallo-hydrolase [Solirubrobacteraceae bacterium]|nr:MBL fold metallo-hydrolase [Solirubrobacteraceae bacterium]
MRELAEGIWDWTTLHEGIGEEVHSHYLADPGILLDPRVPEEGLDWFAEHGPPTRIVLTNRHHLRHSEQFAERFGCPILAHEAGLYDLPDEGITAFGFGDELAPGVVAHEVGVLCPEETAIHAPGVLALADCIIGADGGLGFVSDDLLGDDPEAIKRGIKTRLAALCDELDFDVLLLAHGEPVVGGAREALRAFAQG